MSVHSCLLVSSLLLKESVFIIVLQEQLLVSEVLVLLEELLKGHVGIHAFLDGLGHQVDKEHCDGLMVACLDLKHITCRHTQMNNLECKDGWQPAGCPLFQTGSYIHFESQLKQWVFSPITIPYTVSV